MAALRSLDDLPAAVARRGVPVRVVVAAAADAPALAAVMEARRLGVAEPVLVGDAAALRDALAQRPELEGTAVIHEPDAARAVARSLDMVVRGEADFLMKGAVKTDVLLRAVLDRKEDLGVRGLLSHVAVTDHPLEPRLLLLTDAAVNVAPSLHRKIDIIANAVAVAKALGISTPKVAVLSATERIAYQAMPSTKDADVLAKLCRMGVFGDALVGGPFALDIAVSRDKARHKGVEGGVAGDADILCAPDIEAGNILYKALTQLAGATVAAMVIGTSAPVVLTSRTDTDDAKFYSIVLAALMAK